MEEVQEQEMKVSRWIEELAQLILAQQLLSDWSKDKMQTQSLIANVIRALWSALIDRHGYSSACRDVRLSNHGLVDYVRLR